LLILKGAAFVVDRAIQEKQQKIVHAEGEAEAAKLISFFIQHFLIISYYYY
jgi:prohibitin 2